MPEEIDEIIEEIEESQVIPIPVKDKADNDKLVVSYSSFQNEPSLKGLTSAGDNYLLDQNTQIWYVYDEFEGVFKEFDDNPFNLPIVNKPFLISEFKSTINDILQEISSEYGYDSIDNAISYYNSSVTAWAEEAAAFNTWRDNTLSLMYQNIFSFTADGVTLPDLDGFTGQTGYAQLALGEPSRPQLFL